MAGTRKRTLETKLLEERGEDRRNPIQVNQPPPTTLWFATLARRLRKKEGGRGERTQATGGAKKYRKRREGV